MGKLLEIVYMVTVLVCVTVSMANAQAGTLGFFLNGVAYPNGSTVLRTDIEEGTSALQCTTDSNTCCRNNIGGEMRAGEFHFPISDDTVPNMDGATVGYYRNRDSQLIRLHRQPTGTITGQFRCNIPQASGSPDANLYINIVNMLVAISPFGKSIAGEGYSLQCTVTVTGSNDQPTITWLMGPMNTMITSGVVTTGSMSTLTFDPLTASHAGTYTCRATLGAAVQTEEVAVTVLNPEVTASVTNDPVTPMAGSMLTLTCSVGGAEMLSSPTTTYQWSRNGAIMSDQIQQTLSFTSLAYSDAGQYSCTVDVSSSLLSSSISAQSDPFNVTLTLPDPTIESVVSDPVSPITSGVDVTLTCTVELNSDLSSVSSLGVAITWTGPSGMQLSGSMPMMSGNSPPTPTYTSTLMLSAVMSNGTYTCQAMTTSSSSYLLSSGAMSNDITITVAPAPPTTTEMETTSTAADAMSTAATTNAATTTEISMPTTTSPPASITVDVSITPPGTGTAGESYSLECTVTVTGSTDQPTITWLDPMNNMITSGVMTTDSMSTLTFNPLAASHAGTYTCRATLGSDMDSASMTITVQIPTVTVNVVRSVSTPDPMVGSMYSLTCTVTGAERLINAGAMVTYQWLKNDAVISGQTMATLSFQSLVISDVGNYACQATVTSSLLNAPISTNSTNTLGVSLTLPDPMVAITSSPVSPIRPVGSNVTLTCTVDLSPLVDVPVTVNAQISGPAGATITSPTNSEMVNSTRYTSTSMVSSFGRNQSGKYTCTATVELMTPNSFIIGGTEVTGMDSITVGTGVYLSLKGVIYANNSVIQITEIGVTDPATDLNDGLQCVTDRMPCCRFDFRAGEWYMYTPERTMVPGPSSGVSFYRNRGLDDGTVNLNHNSSVMMPPTGLFCCEVPDAAEDIQPLCVNIVSIGVVISTNGTSTAGQTYFLNCSVVGTTDAATYQWLDSNGTQLTSSSQLEFSPLLASDAGTYTCRATVGSVVVVNSSTLEINFPAPSAVTVTAPVSVIAGSSVTLTCTVELTPAVDVPVAVNTEWAGPEVMFMPANPVLAVMVNLTTYTSTVSVSAARNGSYTCQATVTSGGTTSGAIDITVAPLPPPTNLRATATATSITLTWEQPMGANAVDKYEINYLYIIEECQLEGGRTFPSVTVSVNDGTLRRYTINSSALSPVEEDSDFSITLTAVNSVTRSGPSQPALTKTAEAAPGLVQSITASSVNVTGITIRWDRVDCQERNGHTDTYRVVYYPVSDPNVDTNAVTIFDNNRMFSISGQPPRTSYTFEIQASNPNVDMRGPPAFYTANTTAPQDLGFLLDGQLYPNNSVVTVTDIGRNFFSSALFCLTPSLECCSDSETPNAASVTREWYLPDGRAVTPINSPFTKTRVSSAMSLHTSDPFSTAESGVYHCEIPDASGTTQDIYIGIYPLGDGSPSITSLLFDRNSTTLTCTSTGGPPTTVSWKKDGVPVDLSLYEQSQRLVDAESATYQSVLFNDSVTNFVGTFTCEVSNVRVTVPVQETVELNGVFIVRDQFRIGESATASCKSDAPATMIEWLRDGMVVESASNTQELDLMFSPVNDSIHNRVYVCRVTRDGGNGVTVTAAQNFTVNVDVPPTAITATVSSSGIARAGMAYSLTCTVTKTVDGLINSPTATWTTEGVAVTNGNGITVSTMATSETAISTLTFDPLRTSHNAQYSCDGTLTSQALDETLTSSMTMDLRVQISTPDVDITVPPGPLFAGSIAPLTLTCSVSINAATDTDVVITNTDVTWLRGSSTLSNGDARVTISPVTGSRPSFTSTLTIDPLSTADNTTFTCRARARPPPNVPGDITASDMGEQTASVLVNLPSPPTVSIDPFNSLEMAGQPLTLTCSASIQEGIRGSPVLTWTKEDASLSSDVTSSPPTLSFPSLRTSHAGRYTCTARLDIPGTGVDISGDRTTNVSVQFMPPPPIISGSPRNTSFFQGLDLIFTCSITLGNVVDTSVTVRGIWNRNGTELMDGDEDGRISIINPPMTSPPYEITLRFTPLNVSDAGTYQCGVTVTPQDTTFISPATTSNSRNISVSGFPTQFVDDITDEGVSLAGFSDYTLICNTSREPDLPPTSTLAVQWLDPRGNIISNGENFTISGAGPTTNDSLISRLVFNNSLYTSQAGEYTCRTLQTIPGTVTNHPELMTFPVQVKLLAPISPLTFRRSRNTTLTAGTSFSLTCIITPNTTGVDTDIIVESSIVGNGVSDTDRVSVSRQPISVGENTSETTVTFVHLLETDTGAYNCSAYITSPQPNVIDSDSNSDSAFINIGPLQAPTVSVSPSQGISVEAGSQETITCNATFDEYLVQRPTLIWQFPDGSSTVDTTEGDQSGTQVTSTRALIFNRIRTSQAGVYTCRATIDIQGINPRSQTADQNISVQIPRPVFTVLPHSTAYNGTNLTINGSIELDSNVDTLVTVSGMWTGGTAQETTASPYLIMLSLLPVATDSSGIYNVTYTIRSSDSSQYVVEYNGQDSYNLAVEPLPSRRPTISIASRRELDGCGEVMTLNCTADQVQNLFSPPTIEWIDPDGNEVPSIESNNRRMNPQTGQLIFSDITTSNRGRYTCHSVVNIPDAEINDYLFGTDTVQVSTSFPGKVGNLSCARSSSASELSFSWVLPSMLGNEVVSYQVMVNRLEHRPGTRDVIQSSVINKFVEELRASATELAAQVPYNITVKALNLAGCGEENQTYCFTQEGVPEQPKNVMINRVDATTMMVSWDKLTLVELKGLADYVITYSLGGGSRKRQTEGTVTVPWTENSVTISNLQSGAAYSVAVGARTSAGMSTQTTSALEAVPNDVAAIVGGIIAAFLLVILVVLIVIIVIYFVKRRRTSKFSPGHMYDTSAKASTEERELHPIDNGTSQPPINEKEKEALEESAIVPPPTAPRSVITTEVLDRMKPVSQTSFRDHVAGKHEDRDKGFESEYQSFGTDPVNSHEIAKLPINRPKNRFANIFPYDHSRVKLNNLPGEEGSDYINACSLDGYKREGCYIASQGPMPNTISDFWRMVWEKRLPNIVMLTKCLEAGRRKCEQYWADNIGEDYQTPDKKLNITTTSVMPYADFVIRTFSVKSLTDASLDPLSVTQYHFTSWPDHGVPKFATSLISFIRRVQRGHTKDSGRQLLVHCSAGVGRTGTFITLDSMLDRMAAKEPDVNVYEFVYNMRQRRVLMVQTLAQYVFIHDALNELITCGQTDIVASALRTKVNFLSKVIPAKGITGFQNQFQLLEQVSRLPVDEDLTDAMEPYNQGKNRYPDKIPYNMSRARLRPTGEDGSEYINASFIDGYKQRNAYIATQGPLQNTVNDIWRMLYEFKSRTLVMLCNMNEDGEEASYPYFPSKEEEAVKYGKMLVTLQAKASYTDFIVRKFSIQEDKQGSPKNDGFVVTQFHLTEWAPRQVPNTGTLIEMLDMITKNQMSTGNRPITVMCNNGVGRTGTFICIHAQLERLKTEGVVDFFQSIKSARIQRAGLVPDVDQYAFCHTVLADYIDKFDNYANFKDMVI